MRSNAPGPELLRAALHCVRDYLCVSAADNVLITTDTAADTVLIEALQTALMLQGARASVLTIPQLPMQGSLADPFIPPAVEGAAERSDVWMDLTFPYIAGSHAQANAMRQRPIRYLLCSDLNSEAMTRLFGSCELQSVTDAMAKLYGFFAAAVGKTLRVTTPSGTDVEFVLAPPELPEPAHISEPGLYMLPGASTLIPELESTRGTVVLETVFHEYYTPLEEPVVLHVDGRIRSFEGGGHQAPLLDRVLRRAGGGDDYGYIIHFTHGFHPTARVTGNCFVEDMRAEGSNAVGMGLPFWQPGGGENHPDAVMTRQSIWLEGEQIVHEGVFLGDSALAGKCRSLLPLHR